MIVGMHQRKAIIEALKSGKVVAFPTETVYGLGVISGQPSALERLFEVKNRPIEKQVTMMVSSIQMIESVASLNETAKALIRAFMPGPITLILPKKDEEGTVGVRFPNSPFISEIIEAVRVPLYVTSANISGEEVLNDAQSIDEQMNVDLIVEGPIEPTLPSTIVDCINMKIIRIGSITKEQLEEVIGENSVSV